MTKDEALKMALYALEDLFGTPMNHTGGAVAVWRMDGSDAPRRAITEIKAALAQPVQPEIQAYQNWVASVTTAMLANQDFYSRTGKPNI
jgi:hypothetical protein